MTIAATHRARGRPVYLVDDDPAVLNALQFSLNVEGYDVAAYSSGNDFLKALDDLGDGCLVIDYHLPDMNGLDLTKIVRARGVKSPVILITSNREPAMLRRAHDAGVSVIQKPLIDAALKDAIRTATAYAPPKVTLQRSLAMWARRSRISTWLRPRFGMGGCRLAMNAASTSASVGSRLASAPNIGTSASAEAVPVAGATR